MGCGAKWADGKFLARLSEFYAADTARTVTAQSFLDKAGVASDFTPPPSGAIYTTEDIDQRLASAILVYGAVREAGGNRYAAEQRQHRYINESEIAAGGCESTG